MARVTRAARESRCARRRHPERLRAPLEVVPAGNVGRPVDLRPRSERRRSFLVRAGCATGYQQLVQAASQCASISLDGLSSTKRAGTTRPRSVGWARAMTMGIVLIVGARWFTWRRRRLAHRWRSCEPVPQQASLRPSQPDDRSAAIDRRGRMSKRPGAFCLPAARGSLELEDKSSGLCPSQRECTRLASAGRQEVGEFGLSAPPIESIVFPVCAILDL